MLGRCCYPMAVRHLSQPWGLGMDGRSVADKHLLENSSKCILVHIHWVEVCFRLGLPCWMDNLGSSMLWLLRELKRLAELRSFHALQISHFGWGAPFRKDTVIWTWHMARPGGNDARWKFCWYRRCRSEKGSICCTSGKKHIVLTCFEGGTAVTLQGKRYPLGLCEELALLVRSSPSVMQVLG